MKIGKMALIKMINETKWVKFTVGYGRNKLQPDQISVHFGASKKGSEIIDRVTVNIGDDIVKKMGWIDGDKIIVMHHPDNLMHFNLCKSDNKEGAKLGKNGALGNPRIQFKWPYKKLPLQRETIAPVDYHIVSNQLLVFIVK
jgi:hypothetical protein